MKKRFLVTSILMLLLTVFALSTSTYAWFSMNITVRATGLEVTAKSNATYLLIGDDKAKAEAETKLNAAGQPLGETIAAKYVTADNDEKKCYPTAYYTEAGTLNGHAVSANKWYKTNSNKQDLAVSGTGDVAEVTEGDKDYMLTYKVWLTLSKDSEPSTTRKLKVTFAKSGDVATSAVVLIGNEGANGKFALNSTNTNQTTAAAVNLTNSTSIEVTVYVYIDGNSDNVNSEYVQENTLTGTVSLQFDLVD